MYYCRQKVNDNVQEQENYHEIWMHHSLDEPSHHAILMHQSPEVTGAEAEEVDHHHHHRLAIVIFLAVASRLLIVISPLMVHLEVSHLLTVTCLAGASRLILILILQESTANHLWIWIWKRVLVSALVLV